MQQRSLMGLKLVFIGALCVVTISQGRILAQTSPSEVMRAAAEFDEYGLINGEDHSARLDNFAIQLDNMPGSTAYIVAYGPEGEGSGLNQFNLDSIKNYLVNTRGISEQRIRVSYGGRNRDLAQPKIELWIVPLGAPDPEIPKVETDINTFRGLFSDRKAWDYIPLAGDGDGTLGPPIADVAEAAFADMLEQQKTATAYVVAYNGPHAMPGAWRRVAERTVDELKKYKTDGSRLKIIYGGNAKETRVQLWIVSAGSPPPVRDAGFEPPPERAVQLGSFSEDEIGNTDNERAVFTRLTEVLRAESKLRACLIVTHGTVLDEEIEPWTNEPRPPEQVQTSSDDVIEISESKAADLPVLIEKWRRDLASKYSIGEDRFIVLYTAEDEFVGNSLEAWVVPQNAPLPDPKSNPAEEVLSQGETEVMLNQKAAPEPGPLVEVTKAIEVQASMGKSRSH